PTRSIGGNTLFLFSGLIRFGQDGGPHEDLRNEANEYAEAAEDDTPRTVMLRLRAPTLADSQFIGSGTLTAFGNVCLTTNDSFGAAVDNGTTQLTQPVEDGNQLARDLWLLSDINAERATDDTSLMNRMAYQANVLVLLK